MSKILQYVYGLGSGGIEAFVTNLNSCTDVFDEPFDFLLFGNSDQTDFYEQKNRDLGSRIIKVGDNCSSIFFIRCIQKRIRAYKVMKKNRYEIVHIHNSSVFGILEAIAAKLAGVPKVVVHSHLTALGGKGLIKAIKFFFQVCAKPLWPLFVDFRCACSTEAGIWMFGKKAIIKGDVYILKNGIRSEDFCFCQEIREIYRKKLGFTNQHVYGHVGRFEKQKNHIFLIDIFSEIITRDPDARLLLIGSGGLENTVKEKVMKMRLSEYITFLGNSDEVNNWLQAMDVFIFPSLYEGLPLSGIEAQATGLPVIASDSISHELEITDLVTWMSLERSAAEWAEITIRKQKEIIRDKNSRKQILESGYDIEETARLLNQIYKS